MLRRKLHAVYNALVLLCTTESTEWNNYSLLLRLLHLQKQMEAVKGINACFVSVITGFQWL